MHPGWVNISDMSDKKQGDAKLYDAKVHLKQWKSFCRKFTKTRTDSLYNEKVGRLKSERT